MTRRVPAALLAGMLVAGLVGVAITAAPATQAAAAGCDYPGAHPPESWARLPEPAAPYASVGMLDRDPCQLLGAAADGTLWHSTNAGEQWSRTSGGGAIRSVLTEGLALASGDRLTGPVLATGDGPAGANDPVVLVSDDEGATFTPAQAGTAAPLHARVLSAAAAPHVGNGVRSTYVYLVVATPASGAGLVPGTPPSTLLRSTDGGQTFTSLSIAGDPKGGAGNVHGSGWLAPTVVAINPTAQDEVWINSTDPAGGGGAWMSIDGGQTFNLTCCADFVVRDIALTPMGAGYVQVLLATDKGVVRSTDGGQTWARFAGSAPSYGVRTPPDDPATILSATAHGVERATGPAYHFTPMTGTPTSCQATGLRRTAVVPPTFLLDCGASVGTYRLTLSRYNGHNHDSGGGTPPPPPPYVDCGGFCPTAVPRGRPLAELATWHLPGATAKSGAIAFDGTNIVYDMQNPDVRVTHQWQVGRIHAKDGTPQPSLVWPYTTGGIDSLTVDLRRNQLLVGEFAKPDSFDGSYRSDLHAYDLATLKIRDLGHISYHVPTYDAASDQLSWIPEGDFGPSARLTRTTTYPPTPTGRIDGKASCSVASPPTVKFERDQVSTFVASGDGGGYIQDEDDATLFRIDRTCRITGVYNHRKYSESYENDAMACDTQTFFPQAAIWIRDSIPQTATAYAVPFGYCPMPSALALTGPSLLQQGQGTQLCTHLINHTTGAPAALKSVVISVAGVVVGRGETDGKGDVCVPYVAHVGPAARRLDTVTARFVGDSALLGSVASAPIVVVKNLLLPPPPVPPIAVAPVPPPPPPPPVIPAQPVANVINAPAVAQAPAPNVAQAAMGQTQPVSNAVMVAQRQEEPQLVFARAATALQQEVAVDDAMSALPVRHRTPYQPLGAAVVLGFVVTCGLTVSRARRAPASAPAPSRRTRNTSGRPARRR
jgi:hypothetical protein